ELRRIDWRATARRGRLTARNYVVERNQEIVFCLDTGRLMGTLLSAEGPIETKLDRAIDAVIRLAAVALRAGDRVGLLSFGGEAGAWVRPDKGRAQIGRLLEALHRLEAEQGESSYLRALGALAARQKK